MKKFFSVYKFHLVIFLAAFLVLSRFNFDPDLGWHLAIGEHFFKTGEIIKYDQFSWTIPGHRWEISYLLYQILAVYLFKNVPLFLIGIIFGLAASLGVLILLKKEMNWTKVLAIFPACGILALNLGIRPHLFSLLLFVIMLKFLEMRLYLKYAHAVLWFLMFVLWVNLHQGFLIGLLVLGTYAVIEGIIEIREKRLTPILVLCPVFGFLGTLVNPFGVGIWTSILRDSAVAVTWTTVAEFQPIVVFSAGSLLFAATGAIFVYVFIKKMKKVEPHFFLIGALLFSASFITALLVFLWGAVYIFIVSRYLDFKLKIAIDKFSKIPLYIAIFSVAASLILSFVTRLLSSISIEQRLLFDGYPVAAADFLREKKLTNNLFNAYAWGGYLDWKLPEAKVFIDGRMASWRKADGGLILSDYMEVIFGKCDVLKNYEIRVVLVQTGGKSKCFDDFNLAYQDKVAEVWTREAITNYK